MNENSNLPNDGESTHGREGDPKEETEDQRIHREFGDDYSNDDEDASKPAVAIRIYRSFFRRRKWRRTDPYAPKWTDIFVAFFTFGLLFSSIVQIYIYKSQTEMMRESLNQTERSVILSQGQLQVANRNANISEQAFNKSQQQFSDTLGEMKKQSRASLSASRTTERQLSDAEKQTSARLTIENFRVDRADDSPIGNSIITFDLINEGGTEARQITESGSEDGMFRHGMKPEDSFAETAVVPIPSPKGFPLGAGQKKSFHIYANGWIKRRQGANSDWFGWKRFTYRTIYETIESECVLATASKGGIGQQQCLPGRIPE